MPVTKSGLVDFLETVRDSDALDFKIRLHKNDPAGLDADLELADLVEADFSGYAAKDPSDFDPAALNPGNQAFVESGVLTWTADNGIEATQTIYGAYVTFKNAGDVLCLYGVARFNQPQSVVIENDTIVARVNFFAWDAVP